MLRVDREYCWLAERSGHMRRICGFIVIILGTAGVRHIAGVPAEPLRFVAITAGADHACALTERGEAYCWGSNQFGQIGNGAADARPHRVPVRVTGDLKFTTVAAGITHTCGIVRGGA